MPSPPDTLVVVALTLAPIADATMPSSRSGVPASLTGARPRVNRGVCRGRTRTVP